MIASQIGLELKLFFVDKFSSHSGFYPPVAISKQPSTAVFHSLYQFWFRGKNWALPSFTSRGFDCVSQLSSQLTCGLLCCFEVGNCSEKLLPSEWHNTVGGSSSWWASKGWADRLTVTLCWAPCFVVFWVCLPEGSVTPRWALLFMFFLSQNWKGIYWIAHNVAPPNWGNMCTRKPVHVCMQVTLQTHTRKVTVVHCCVKWWMVKSSLWRWSRQLHPS